MIAERIPHVHAHLHDAPVGEEIVRVSCVKHSYEDGTSVHLCGLDFVVRRARLSLSSRASRFSGSLSEIVVMTLG